MAFIEATNVAEVHLRGRLDGEYVENVTYWLHDGAMDTSDMLTLAEYVGDWWQANIKPLQTNTFIHQEVYVVDLTTQTSPTVVDLSHTGEDGDQSGSPPLPNNVAPCISFRSAARGRSSRGRNYTAGWCEAQIIGNLMDNSVAALWVSAYEEFITTPPTDWTWVVLSRYHDNAPRAAGVTFQILSCGFTDNVVDSMRSRLPGRGR